MISSGLRAIFILAVSTIVVFILGLFTSWIDRKVTARVQARIGPPWYQPIADILKLLGKETLVPQGSGRTVFIMAPLFGFAGATLASALLGYVLVKPEGGFIGDIVVLVYLLMIPAISLILGASASGNPLAIVGASREMKLILGYELPYLIAVATVVIKSDYDFRLANIVGFQVQNGVNILSISGVIGFVVLLMSSQAKLGLVPFDISEADQELMGGIITEYSGALLGIIRMTKTILIAIIPLFIIILLFGGIQFRGFSILWGIVQYLFIIVLVVLIRNTNPRVRIDQAMKFFWGPMTILAIVGLALAFWGF
jgi:NADH-quinone oxidoreductase subunit H